MTEPYAGGTQGKKSQPGIGMAATFHVVFLRESMSVFLYAALV
jgi:hypothetical protein